MPDPRTFTEEDILPETSANALDQAADLLRSAQRVAVMTGAGISAESGLATFRGAGGLWEGHPVEEVATPHAFRRDPGLVWRFYNARRANLAKVQPNPGHQALADLEDRLGEDRFTLITQNVDGLHRAAGSKNILELHGSLLRVRCSGCGQIEERGTTPLPDLPRCLKCQELLRPDVVWFHEALPEDIWQKAEEAARMCQCFLLVGTSAIVYPAAGLIYLARDQGAKIIEINIAASEASAEVDIRLRGPSGTILPELIKRMER
jgi:NAD-dependent deacetylase